MDLNDTEMRGSSPSKDRSVFYCPKSPHLTWDLNETTFPWILVSIKSLASLITIFLNALVILIIKEKKQFQKNSYILLSSLAVADLLVGATAIPLSASVDLLFALRASLENVCSLDTVNVYLVYCVSWCALYHLTAVAWERYVAIRKTIDYLFIVTRSRIIKLAITVWLSAIFTTIPPLIMEVNGVDMSFVEIWITAASVCGALCLMVMVYFYVEVYLGVRKRRLDQISQVTALIQAKQEAQVAKTTGLLTLALLISFAPGIIVSGFQALRTGMGVRMSELLMQLSSLANPLLYCYRDRRFRKAALEFLRMKKPQAVQQAPGAVRAVRRNDPTVGPPKNSPEKQNPDTTRLTRSASCEPIVVDLDCAHRRSELMLNRSISAPSLAQRSSLSDCLQTQQPSCIVITTATVHVERRARQHKVSVAELPKDAERPPCTEKAVPSISRSSSYDDANTCAKDENVEEGYNGGPQSAPQISSDEIVPGEMTSGFTTKL